MDRQPSRNPTFIVVLLVVGLVAAVAIAVAFDSPTSVFLLGGLAAGFALLSIPAGAASAEEAPSAGSNGSRRKLLSTFSRMTAR